MDGKLWTQILPNQRLELEVKWEICLVGFLLGVRLFMKESMNKMLEQNVCIVENHLTNVDEKQS